MKHSLLDEIKAVCEKAVEDRSAAGLNVLVMKNGQEAAYYEAGFQDLENAVPMKRDAIFRLYSMSKPVTAAAAMILLERGVISLDEPVYKYLPSFQHMQVVTENGTVPAQRDINLRDLLSMQSGMPYGGTSAAGVHAEQVFNDAAQSVDREGTLSTIDFAMKLGEGPAEFQPGSQWMYGSSADIMGAVIEAASGKKFGEFLQDEIFGPLNMKDTGFFIPAEKRDRFAKTYEKDADGKLNELPTTHLGISYEWKQEPAFESGGAGLVSTIDDYKKFCLMLLAGGKYGDKRILRKKTVDYMRSSQLLPSQREGCWQQFEGLRGYGYGNFCRTLEDPGMSYDLGCKGEYGWDGWLGCYFAILPEENIVILSMKQLKDCGTDSVTRKLRDVILSHLAE